MAHMSAVALILAHAKVASDAVPQDWLLLPPSSLPDAAIVEGSHHGVPTLTLTNGLASRTFAVPSGGFGTIALSRSGFGSNCDAGGANFLRATSPEAEMRLDGVNYSIGGLVGQRDFAFLNVSELPELTSPAGAFRYSAHRTGAPTARYKWAPGVRHSDASLSWPRLALSLSLSLGRATLQRKLYE